MSEPWLVEQPIPPYNAGCTASSIATDNTSTLHYFATSTAPSLLPLSPPALSVSANAFSAPPRTDQNFTTTAADVTCYTTHVLPLGMAAWASRKMSDVGCSSMPTSSSSNPSSSSSSAAVSHNHYGILPQLLDGDYSTLCNKNGRIGIYTKEERVSIISRFQDKRRNRVWKKKIRYHCRKNLADRRVRIKVTYPSYQALSFSLSLSLSLSFFLTLSHSLPSYTTTSPFVFIMPYHILSSFPSAGPFTITESTLVFSVILN